VRTVTTRPATLPRSSVAPHSGPKAPVDLHAARTVLSLRRLAGKDCKQSRVWRVPPTGMEALAVPRESSARGPNCRDFDLGGIAAPVWWAIRFRVGAGLGHAPVRPRGFCRTTAKELPKSPSARVTLARPCATCARALLWVWGRVRLCSLLNGFGFRPFPGGGPAPAALVYRHRAAAKAVRKISSRKQPPLFVWNGNRMRCVHAHGPRALSDLLLPAAVFLEAARPGWLAGDLGQESTPGSAGGQSVSRRRPCSSLAQDARRGHCCGHPHLAQAAPLLERRARVLQAKAARNCNGA